MTRSAVTGVEGAGSGGNSPLRGGCDIDAAPGAAHPTRRVAAPTVARLAATIRLPSTARVAPAWTECRSAEAGEARLAAQFSIEPEWAGADDFVILNSAILDLASGPASVRDEKCARDGASRPSRGSPQEPDSSASRARGRGAHRRAPQARRARGLVAANWHGRASVDREESAHALRSAEEGRDLHSAQSALDALARQRVANVLVQPDVVDSPVRTEKDLGGAVGRLGLLEAVARTVADPIYARVRGDG